VLSSYHEFNIQLSPEETEKEDAIHFIDHRALFAFLLFILTYNKGDRKKTLVILDEIGKMELLSEQFRSVTSALLVGYSALFLLVSLVGYSA
jgi:hypothetical protein